MKCSVGPSGLITSRAGGRVLKMPAPPSLADLAAVEIVAIQHHLNEARKAMQRGQRSELVLHLERIASAAYVAARDVTAPGGGAA